MPSNQPPVPPRVYSGYMWNPFTPSLQYIYDSTIGPSGAYRALTQSDVGGGTVGITGTAQTNDALTQGKLQNLIDSGISLKGTNNSVTFTNSGIYASGIRVPATALSGNSGVSGSPSPFYTSAENGVLFVQQANTHYTQDSIRSVPLQGASVATGGRQGIQTGASSFTVFPANSSRNMLFVQNLNTGSVFLSLSGAASSVNFNMILAAGTALDDAKGGSWSTDTWLGSVSVSGSNGYRITAFEY